MKTNPDGLVPMTLKIGITDRGWNAGEVRGMSLADAVVCERNGVAFYDAAPHEAYLATLGPAGAKVEPATQAAIDAILKAEAEKAAAATASAVLMTNPAETL